jgi:alanyl-tRNA synthetase
VGPEKLTFDFNSAPLTQDQLKAIERLVNERIVENSFVSWREMAYSEVKGRPDVLQFFGDKYGEKVRVVQIGGSPQQLDGFSMELCGGTHTRATGEIGYFRIVGENAIAAGVRRVEAAAGLAAYERTLNETALLQTVAGKLNSPVAEIDKKVEALLAHQKELEKQIRAFQQREAAEMGRSLIAQAMPFSAGRAIVKNVGAASGDTLQNIADALKGQFEGVLVLGAVENGTVSLVASVSPSLTSKVQAGKIIQAIAPLVGGKGGGRPEQARGGGKEASKLDEALEKAKSLLG